MPLEKKVKSERLSIRMKSEDRKYWYSTEIHICVLCGREKKYRARVHLPEFLGTSYKDDICWNCCL
jgi:hypothetical protein